MIYLKILVVTVLGLTITAFFPSISKPYVLQGPHIIQLMTENLGQAQSLFVSQSVIFYNIEPQPEILDDQPSAAVDEDTAGYLDDQPAEPSETVRLPVEPKSIQLEESIRYIFSRAFRSDIVSDTNQRVFIFNGGKTLTVIDGIISDVVESRFDLYKDLLLFRSRETLSERLINLGIDVTISSLGKFNDQLVFVVGAEFPDETSPQVWVDKETFQPLRMIISAVRKPYANSTGILDIRYADWQEIGKIWYPMQIEFIQDGMTVRTVEVHNYQINPNFSEDVFDIARLMSEYGQGAQTPGRPTRNEGLSEVQKTIEEFKKIFE